MRTILTASIIAVGIMAAAPAMAQAVYVGPGGVGVDTGARPDGYDHDRAYWNHRHDRDHYYQGRSAYPDRYREDDDR